MHKLSKLLPVGIKAPPVILIASMGLLMCTMCSIIIFHTSLLGNINDISYITATGSRIFSDTKKMPPYNGSASFDIFKIFFVCLVLFSFYCFIYHFIGAKSFYTMRRLNNPLELYIRCLCIPFIFIIIGIMIICLLNYMFIDIYLKLVPEENLLPWWDRHLWEVL